MTIDSALTVKHLVLVGGGHAHSLLIRKWALNPLPDTRVTLVSPNRNTPYSGMLPGLLAGHYSFNDIHIDLVRLCDWAGLNFIQSEVTAIDLEQKQLKIAGCDDLSFDYLSIDTGSTPNHDVQGASAHTIPIKPIADFWQHWQILVSELEQTTGAKSVSVVGGGAGALESVLAMAWSCRNNAEILTQPVFSLVFQGDKILSAYPARVRMAAEQACLKLNVHLQGNFLVREVCARSIKGEGGGRDDKKLESDFTFWCVQAGAPSWPAKSGLACNEEGFIEVNEFLQSSNYPFVFAAGDIAHMVSNPRPKAGVYAVRQAPYLCGNIQQFLSGKEMNTYIPQDSFLSLLALGEKRATGNKGWFSATGRLVWLLKDRIDRSFMKLFINLPEI